MSMEEWSRKLGPQEFGRLYGDILMQRQTHEKAEKVERFRHLNPFVKPGQILFAGSSLMEQFPIYELMLDLDLPYTIYNRGIGGYTTAEMLGTMQECVYDLKPAYIFLNIGTNDMNGEDYVQEELMARYEAILAGIREHLPEAEMYLMAYYPVNPEVGKGNPMAAHMLQYRTNARIREANAFVASYAERFDGMHYVDANEGLTDENGNLKAEFTIEGIHMYANGYRVVLQNLIPVLQGLGK